ncbi:unnamed protein product [Rhodiola kirilowii]
MEDLSLGDSVVDYKLASSEWRWKL